MINFEPQKGKSLEKLPKGETLLFDDNIYLTSTKYDGNQIWIVKKDDTVRYFTSDWKEFNLHVLTPSLLRNTGDFIMPAELMYDCDGRLGSRRKSAIITTWRTDFKKRLKSNINENKLNIKVFDCLTFGMRGLLNLTINQEARLIIAKSFHLHPSMSIVETTKMTGKEAKLKAKALANDGWEGLMCTDPTKSYTIGKRVNYIVKIKFRKTADLLCIGMEEGEGKCQGTGTLVLKDSEGRIVRVGSGLNYSADRATDFIGKVIEIEYEQIMDTYVQPVFKEVREDKLVKDID